MIRHFLKITLRIFYKRKLYAFISLFGLVIAFSVSFIILIFTINELRINKGYLNFNQLYRVVTHDIKTDTWNAHTTKDLGQLLKSSIPELDGVARLTRSRSKIIIGKESFPTKVLFVDPDFFSMFCNRNGINAEITNNDPYQVIISREIADKYFKQNAQIGSNFTMTIFNREVDVGIANIFPGFEERSTIQADIICLMDLFFKNNDNPLLDWHPFFDTFIMPRKDSNSEIVKMKLDNIDETHFDGTTNTEFVLQSFSEFYLGSSDMGSHYYPTGDSTMLRWLGTTALLLLVISIINYSILSTANSLTRQKEFGIRKTFGSTKYNIRIQAISESITIALIALPLAIILTEILLPYANQFLGKEYEFHVLRQWSFTLIFLLVIIFTGILSGAYLAFYITKLNPTLIIYPGARKSHGPGVGKYLLTGQVFIYIVLVAFSILVLKQMNYFLEKDMGYADENLLVINFERKQMNSDKLFEESQSPRVESFKSEIRKYPEVLNAAGVFQMPPYNDNSGLTTSTMSTESGQQFTFLTLAGDQDILETLGIKILAGRKPNVESEKEFLLNEAAIDLIDIADPIGYKFGSENEIVGMIQNFHIQSFRKKYNPLKIRINSKMDGPFFSIIVRYRPDEGYKVLQKCKDLVSAMFPDFNAEFEFQEDRITALYAKEKKIIETIGIGTILILLISCTGMFALSLYESERRTKEIGIRKINGASAKNILGLLSKEFIKWVVIAFIFASPIAYFIMQKWLDDFVYSTTISWWIFALAGTSAIFITLITISYQTFIAARKNPVEVLRYE